MAFPLSHTSKAVSLPTLYFSLCLLFSVHTTFRPQSRTREVLSTSLEHDSLHHHTWCMIVTLSKKKNLQCCSHLHLTRAKKNPLNELLRHLSYEDHISRIIIIYPPYLTENRKLHGNRKAFLQHSLRSCSYLSSAADKTGKAPYSGQDLAQNDTGAPHA